MRRPRRTAPPFRNPPNQPVKAPGANCNMKPCDVDKFTLKLLVYTLTVMKYSLLIGVCSMPH